MRVVEREENFVIILYMCVCVISEDMYIYCFLRDIYKIRCTAHIYLMYLAYIEERRRGIHTRVMIYMR